MCCARKQSQCCHCHFMPGTDSAAGHSVQWGAWAAVGMAAASAAALARIQRSGMGVIQPAAGLQALRRLLSSTADDPAQVAVYHTLHTPDCQWIWM
jgi:hypothetical protein